MSPSRLPWEVPPRRSAPAVRRPPPGRLRAGAPPAPPFSGVGGGAGGPPSRNVYIIRSQRGPTRRAGRPPPAPSSSTDRSEWARLPAVSPTAAVGSRRAGGPRAPLHARRGATLPRTSYRPLRKGAEGGCGGRARQACSDDGVEVPTATAGVVAAWKCQVVCRAVPSGAEGGRFLPKPDDSP